MVDNDLISGIVMEKSSDNNICICYIENFSDELKKKIREMLSGIWHGVADSNQNQDIYNYKETLVDFLNRYNSQSPELKKGIIGELLTHIIIPNYMQNLEVVSVMKNKEERSIKKGFDSVFYNYRDSSIWYCEVKSGGDEDSEEVNKKNIERLNRAKNGIKTMFDSNRVTLWQSVLNDVNLTIFNSKKVLKIKELLKLDYPKIDSQNKDKNVILSSVIYKELDSKISMDNLTTYKFNINNEKLFSGLVIISTQKPTYKKIENFLIQESSENDD